MDGLELLMPYLKFQVSFSLNFTSLFNVMGDKSSVLLQLKLDMIFTKGAHHSPKFQTAQVKYQQICTLIGYFCWKYIKFQLKKVWRKYVSWYQRVVQNLKKNLFFCFKNDKNLVNFYSSTKKSKKIAFWLVPFFAKYTKFDLKKYRGNIFHDTEEPYEIWRKTDLRFRKWHEEFGKFSSEHFKVSRLVF